MPILIDGERVPSLLSRNNGSHSAPAAGGPENLAGCIRIALINNMPDAALEDTEVQFYGLLESAAGDTPVSLKLYSLPGLPRGDAGQRHLNSFYSSIDDLLSSRFDGMIMTGTEPCQSNLRDEPFWPALTNVLDWAERNTASAILSCLAAHASVLHSDGIPRHRLPDKQFGVFEYKKVRAHALTDSGGNTTRIPHSRWNEVQSDALNSCGYEVLTESAEAGVDTFVKKKKDSLFIHFQGHPEYGSHTLLKEYRRDIKRFIRRERNTYPTRPAGYFSAAAEDLLSEFQKAVMSDPREEMLGKFPEATVTGALQANWQGSASSLYKNWLQYLLAQRADGPTFSPKASAVRA